MFQRLQIKIILAIFVTLAMAQYFDCYSNSYSASLSYFVVLFLAILKK